MKNVYSFSGRLSSVLALLSVAVVAFCVTGCGKKTPQEVAQERGRSRALAGHSLEQACGVITGDTIAIDGGVRRASSPEQLQAARELQQLCINSYQSTLSSLSVSNNNSNPENSFEITPMQ